MQLSIYNLKGEKTGEKAELSPEIFGLAVNQELVGQAAVVERANRRQRLAKTLTRAERRGGGAKPWKQKGTGRARAGSRRSPLWRKGGIIFGPTEERNFKLRINKKMKIKAIKMIFSERAQNKAIVILEELKLTKPKTKEMALLLKKLPLNSKPLILLAEPKLEISRATRNLPNAKVLNLNNISVLDLLNYNSILMAKSGLVALEARYRARSRD